MLTQTAIDAILQAYPRLGLLQRYHLQKRLAWCPYDKIASLIPNEGVHLDLGCGYAHFLVYLAQTKPPSLQLIGCDPDPRKLKVAKTASAFGQRIQLLHGFRYDGSERLTSVSLIDVLYLMPKDSQDQLIRWIYGRLAPGGVLIIKGIDVEQGVRSQLAMWQEFVMVDVLRRTLSSGTWRAGRCLPDHVKELRSVDFDVQAERLEGTRTPSLLICATKPFLPCSKTSC